MASLLPLVPIRLVPIPARAKPRAASSQPSLRAFGGRNTQTGPTAALGLGPTPKFDCDSPELLPSLSLSLSLSSFLPSSIPIPPTSLSTLPVPPSTISPTTMSTAELACSYAALILADDGVEVTVRTWPLLSVLELCAMDGRIIYWD